MAGLTKLDVLKSELARLRRQQLEATDKATYLGWTQQERIAFKRRADRMAEVLSELSGLDGTAA